MASRPNRYRPSEVKAVQVRPKTITRERATRWHEETDPVQSASGMVAAAKGIDKDQVARRAAELLFAKLYCGQNLQSLYQVGVARSTPATMDPWGVGPRPSYNVVASVIDTAGAKIAKNKPRALFLTEGGSYDLRSRSKKLTQYVDGVFYENDAYEHGRRAFVDAGWCGLGAVKVWPDREAGMVRLERVLPFELLFDDTEWMRGAGRTMYQKTYLHRDQLLDMFGRGDKNNEKRSRILDAPGQTPGDVRAGTGDMVEVFEGWHLQGADDKGRHMWAIDGCELFREDWPKDFFPFSTFTLRPGIVGIRGIGWAEDLLGIQLEISKILRVIQRAQHLMSVPRVFTRNAASVKTQWNNDIGTIIEGDDAVTIAVAQAMSPEVYEHLEKLYQKAFEVTGVSQLSANAQKPAGLDAAVALREFHDIESERFVLVGQRYEEFFMRIARMVVDTSRDLYADAGKLRIKAPGTKFIDTIDWKDIDLKEDEYVIKTFPTSFLPTTPAGKLQRVQELVDAGMIDKEYAKSLLDFPDLEGAMSMQLSGVDSIQRMISSIIDHGGQPQPEPEQPLQLGIQLCQDAVLRAENDGVSPKRIEKLRRWMDAAKDLLDQINAPPPAPPAPPQMPAAPPAPGMPDVGAPVGAASPTGPVFPSPAVASDLPA